MKMNKRIAALIAKLRSKNGAHRTWARETLVDIGQPAVPFLIGLMMDPDDHVRWEACKALVSIKDATAAVPLVVALRDESPEVRWLAAEALIAIGEEALAPLLQALESHFDSEDVLHGAHHVLRALKEENVLNEDALAVLDKLSYLGSNLSAAFPAQKVQGSIWKLAKVAGLKNEENR